MRYNNPPSSEAELLDRAQTLTGKTLGNIADILGISTPENLDKNKGWIGQLFEKYLVTSAGTQAEPDFREIGVELKSIPLDNRGKPRESTYVTMVNLIPDKNESWETSMVRIKLLRVLWIPIEGDPGIPVFNRRIGNAILWSPGKKQEMQLKQDWEELIGLVHQGKVDEALSEYGVYLQIRPKGLNAKSLQYGSKDTGEKNKTLPRGFYLRPAFTNLIFNYPSPES